MSTLLYQQVMSISGIVGIWVIWHYLWKPQRVDLFRQRLFALRDELFDMAASGEISFDAPAYTRLRFLMNGMIQYAHRISFPLLIVSMIIMKEAPKSSRVDWQQTLNGLPDGPHQKLLDIHERVSDAFARQLIYGSVSLVFVLLGLTFFSTARFLLSRIFGADASEAFSSAEMRRKVTKTTRIEVSVIEARVMYEEQWRAQIRPLAPA